MSSINAEAIERLPAAARPAIQELAAGLIAAAADNLAALVVYGSAARGGFEEGSSDIDVIVVLRDTALPQLVALSQPLLQARFKARVEAMVLKLRELPEASDVFPLFYDDVRSRHLAVVGSDPFAGLTISDAHRRLRIEQELREARIRMRRAAVDAMGIDAALTGAIARKVKQVRGPIHALLRLKGIECDDALEAVLRESGRAFGLDTAPLLRIREDPGAAHTAFRALLDAATHEADRLPVAPPANGRPEGGAA